MPYLDLILAVVNGEGTTAFGPLIESERLDLLAEEGQRVKLREASSISARTYIEAMRERRRVRAAFAAIFAGADAIFTYTLPWEPSPIDEVFEPIHPTRGFTGMVAASNLAELPALFLPVGLSDNGLPVGIQLVGPPFSEPTLVAIGELFQGATGFHRLRPPMAEHELALAQSGGAS
jgi:aspartyl-tRNA(Asn)/glutamyl-tRNA(Gln) amidotransferase subunit A